ncbi:MAG: ORF6N domain-containing protein [Crocinitomicaceae bacterium]|nr:ORF6N domain-containing protein [Flavobacteriales bacterium]NQZ36990.1 ORF6N domain-containing protein [Crocinitomicaceae bacterium]
MNSDQMLVRSDISNKIFQLREVNVMLDFDLAELYQVETKRINEQVKRNTNRFPGDFMFQLTEDEHENLKSHFATSSWGGRRKPPYAFTEHGVLMLSSVLKSDRAVAVNIQIMRVYIELRKKLRSEESLNSRMDQIEETVSNQNNRILTIVDYLYQKDEEEIPRRKVGYKE